MHYQHGPISTVAGNYAREILWPNAGVGPEDVDVTGSYDAFTFTTMLQLEDYGFCKKGEGGHYVSDGTIRLGGKRPNNTSGGHLCEGYTHGMNMVIENVRQLRHDVDDSCPVGPDGKRQHTYDYKRRRLPAGEELRGDRQPRLGHAGHRLGHGHAARLSGGDRHHGESQADYLGMPLSVDDLDGENLAYFKHCAEHDFHLQHCDACQLLRYPPTTACPWCMSPKSNWVPVEGKGAVHSYTEVHHAIQPAFKAHTPYLILLVDLDTQKGKPTDARGPARGRQPRHAGRQAGAARAWSRRSASARACAWCSPTWRRASRSRSGPSTRAPRSPTSRGAIRRSEASCC